MRLLLIRQSEDLLAAMLSPLRAIRGGRIQSRETGRANLVIGAVFLQA